MRWMRLRKVATSTLQPRAQPAHTEGTFLRNQTRARKRNGFQVKAPTGQTSTVQPEYGLSSGFPGNVPMIAWSPRWNSDSSRLRLTSSQNRMQRVHLMQRSASNTTLLPMS